MAFFLYGLLIKGVRVVQDVQKYFTQNELEKLIPIAEKI